MTRRLSALTSLLQIAFALLLSQSVSLAQAPSACSRVIKSVVVTEVTVYRDWQGSAIERWAAHRIPAGTKIDRCAPNRRLRIIIAREIIWIDEFAVATGEEPRLSPTPDDQHGIGGARADADYPTKPLTIVVTTAPGGLSDIIARTLSQKLTADWSQQVIVENRAGAAGTIGATHVARSTPDGYTLLLISESAIVINPSLFPQLPYDRGDLVPVTGIVSIPYALVANPKLPAKGVKELIELSKRDPGKIKYGTTGTGSVSHLSMAMLETMAGVKLTAIPFPAAAPALSALSDDHIDVMFMSLGAAMQPAQAGRLKLLAVGSPKRVSQFPDLPTVAESGLDNFNTTSWVGLFVPRGTPQEIVAKLNAEMRRVVDNPSFQENVLNRLLLQPFTSSSEEFATYINSDRAKWDQVIRASRLRTQ